MHASIPLKTIRYDQLVKPRCHQLVAVHVLVEREFHVGVKLEAAAIVFQARRGQEALIAAIRRIRLDPAVVQSIGDQKLQHWEISGC